MRVLVACEFSGAVRDAFQARGHDAWSCDMRPSEQPGNHIEGDVLPHLGDGWDLMIAHPPCTHLAVSGAAWFEKKAALQTEALTFVRALLAAPIAKIALENPVSIISTSIRKPDQVIHPWQFGHGAMKTTCLWLKGLSHLQPTQYVAREYTILPNGKRYPRWSYDTFRLPAATRAKERSRTFHGIAQAMAAQWGDGDYSSAIQDSLFSTAPSSESV